MIGSSRHGLACVIASRSAEPAARLERTFVRVDVVVAAVRDLRTDPDHLALGQRSLHDRSLETVVDGGDELGRDTTLGNLVHELVVRGGSFRQLEQASTTWAY